MSVHNKLSPTAQQLGNVFKINFISVYPGISAKSRVYLGVKTCEVFVLSLLCSFYLGLATKIRIFFGIFRQFEDF